MDLNEFKASIPSYIDQAIETGNSITGGEVELKPSVEYIKVLDAVVEYIHGLWKKKLIDNTVAWNISVTFGVFLGEMMIREHGFYWIINNQDIPAVAKDEKHIASPITKIYKIITDEDDCEGTPSAFYDVFITIMQYR